ncbi:hypothetical protein BBJ28_00010017 [Nothophytophthora sp. Chile5]|nr:hypothetical protein BBJ28_00010017 [Nothophytophthora sp. Chile5]
MMQGMLDFLTGASSGAAVLRRHFIFKVVPMLNPDGVINGNTRVSLAGWDLNRKWNNPIEQLFPTVFHLKRQLAHFQLRGRVAIYCDLHGHSLNRNIFTYGCWTPKKRASAGIGLKAATVLVDDTDAPSVQSYSASVKTDPRVFPMIVARHAPSFSFASCDFKVHKSKMNTARVVVHQELGVANSYTLEASFCGPDFGVHKDTQFSTWDLEEMGRSWCQSLLVYYGLLAQVKALDAAREAQEEETQQSVDERAAIEEQPVQSRGQEEMTLVGVEDDDSCLARDLLRDCEAAITAMFALAGIDRDEEEDHDGNDAAAMDSDLSGAEEEPIPPTTTDEKQERSQRTHRRRPEQRYKDAEVPVHGEDGCTSAPEESPTRKGRSSTSNNHGRKKTARHKRSRGGVSSSKPATSGATAARKGEGKSKKKKKKKSRRASTAASLVVGPMAGDAAFSTLGNNPPALLVPSTPAIEPALKPSGKKAAAAKRHSSKTDRPRTSRDVSKATARERLQDEAEAEHLSLGSLKLRPLLVSPNNLKPAVLLLPSVLNGGDARPPRVLRTAPAYDREFAPSDQQLRSTLVRVRSGVPLELPALQRSGRGDQQHRQLWQRTGDEDADNGESERSEPEADTSEF